MIYFCCDDKRRATLRADPKLNGIDFLEVEGDYVGSDDQRQRVLQVHFVNSNGLDGLDRSRVSVEGGERITKIEVLKAGRNPDDDQVLTVLVDKRGDFSPYNLGLINGPDDPMVPGGFDPVLSSVQFSFKAGCPSDIDCRPVTECPAPVPAALQINYLSKDYAGFRQLMLDRMALLTPNWQERHPADLGIALVELLAYVGDQLSYKQDAIGTEAYLGTARSRISVRRHARLVDYHMHDGCNARVWLRVRLTGSDALTLPANTVVFTNLPGQPHRLSSDFFRSQRATIDASTPVYFQTLCDCELNPDSDQMEFYTWGDTRCCLPTGATRAALKGKHDGLKVGDVLILAENRDPGTGDSAAANPTRRHAVRLTRVAFTTDEVYNNVDVTEITWADEDALPFPLCLSCISNKASDEKYYPDVSVAWGNIVLADHGIAVEETLGQVEALGFSQGVAPAGDPCSPVESGLSPTRFRPRLTYSPIACSRRSVAPLPRLTATSLDASMLDQRLLPESIGELFSGLGLDTKLMSVEGSNPTWLVCEVTRVFAVILQESQFSILPIEPATSAALTGTEAALPEITVQEWPSGTADPGAKPFAEWLPKPDLLSSSASANEFVVETETDGSARLRFGDNTNGRRPEAERFFTAHYRVGNGPEGNVGYESIRHIVTDLAGVSDVTNPMPARGGTDPETVEHVRQSAPVAFRTQERAVTPEDYVEVVQRHPDVQQAAATFRWTGSWYTVFVAIDRKGGKPVDDDFREMMCRYLERYRMAGYDVAVEEPRYVALEIGMTVCVKPDYSQSDVGDVLRRVFSAGVLPCGKLGVFHPDNFTFEQPVYSSPMYAEAQAVEGVDSVQIPVFRRLGASDSQVQDMVKIDMGRLEIARLDNDSSLPEHGIFRLELRGGR